MNKPARILHVLEKRDARCRRCGYDHRQADMDPLTGCCRWCMDELTGRLITQETRPRRMRRSEET